MSYYRTCPVCGSNLDPGEICDECREISPESKKNKDVPTACEARERPMNSDHQSESPITFYMNQVRRSRYL